MREKVVFYRHLLVVFCVVLFVFSSFSQSVKFQDEPFVDSTGWSDDINISIHNRTDFYHNMDVWNNSIYVVWENKSFGDDSLMLRSSKNNGLTWNKKIQIHPVDPRTPSRPNIAVDTNKIHVVYHLWKTSGWEIYYINSIDGGETWNPSKLISEDDDEWSEGAKIAVNGSNIHVIWVDQRHGSDSFPPNTEIYYKRSTDGGITWDDGLGNIGIDRRLTNAPYASAPVEISVTGSNIHATFVDERSG